MQIDLFPSIKGQGQPATWAGFCSLIESAEVAQKAAALASGSLDEEHYRLVKESLPAVSWQAWFKDGVRKNSGANLNSLVMVDFDHIAEEVAQLWARIAPRREELGIRVAHKTPSTHGLRIVMSWRQGFSSIEENQRWMAQQVGLEFDPHCTDPSRLSFLPPKSYFYYLDEGVFDRDEAVPEWFEAVREGYGQRSAAGPAALAAGAAVTASGAVDVPAGTQTEYKGIALKDIASVLLDCQGGAPVPGQRNARYFAAANELKSICDFNAHAVFLALREGCTLSDAELFSVCSSACKYRSRPVVSPRMQEVLDLLERAQSEEEATVSESEALNTDIDFTLPPIFRLWHDAAPQDFKKAVVLSLLPILGALGSKLRAQYLNGRKEAPSFQVCLSAPSGSGKNFLELVTTRCLRDMIGKDMEGLAMQREFDEKVRLAKLSQGRTRAERAELKELFDMRPRPILRYLPATVSITKMLMLVEGAQGLHLFQFSPEIDTINKAFKRSFSNLSDILRVAWDLGTYGQSYATDTSYSGMVRLALNTLWSGTPKSVERFFSDGIENGTLSRTLFVTLPDQFGKRMETFATFEAQEEEQLDADLKRLSEVSLVDDEVQEEHEMDMGWLNRRMDSWLEAQRQLAVKSNDRTRDTFYRRAAVEGFRAGMVAFFLWGEKRTPAVKKHVAKFSQWVANMMLQGLMSRARIEEDVANDFFASTVYNSLPDEFSREELEKVLRECGFTTPLYTVISMWKSQRLIEKDKMYGATHFKKVKRG